MSASIHAQITSTNRVLRSRWTEVSRGDCIPFGFINLALWQKQWEQSGGSPLWWVGMFCRQADPRGYREAALGRSFRGWPKITGGTARSTTSRIAKLE